MKPVTLQLLLPLAILTAFAILTGTIVIGFEHTISWCLLVWLFLLQIAQLEYLAFIASRGPQPPADAAAPEGPAVAGHRESP